MSRTTFTPAEAVELAAVERSGFIESRHIGSAVVLDPQGFPVLSLGAADAPVFPRSSLKPLQAIAAMCLGAEVSGPAAALAMASHRCEARHAEVVESMLASAGLTPADLRCPAAHPADGAFRAELQERAFRSGTKEARSPLHFNCSGKHAAFLMAAVAQDAATASYLDPDHVVQRTVAEVVEAFAGEPPSAVGVDGCGAPVFALTLTGLARAIGRVVRLGSADPGSADVGSADLSSADRGSAGPSSADLGSADVAGADAGSELEWAREARTLMDGVFAHPWAIEGAGRPNTTVIERLGVFAKGGAEGVIVMATATGYSVAVKCLDGSSRALTPVALTLLDRAGAFDDGRNAVWNDDHRATSANDDRRDISANDDRPAASAKDGTRDNPAKADRRATSVTTDAHSAPATAREKARVTPELLAEVIADLTEPVTGGTDSEGRTAVVGRIVLGEDVSARIERKSDGDSPKN
ncbi:asparaginase [Brevibacterium sanguinis]|uniref:Asparaginase n=2 Tax=Brevibacterium TaxID=1696 RepID=A0A366IE24_9MICO|nr:MULTISPECIES: asparaginase [Brevibacterium]RBP61488.1 asparaginase [Brevibacterium sanguinis]RBP68582.1 asparaginase [Brevibacterium celere]